MRQQDFHPDYLMFGWHPRIPIGACLGIPSSENRTHDHNSYATRLQRRLEFAYKAAAEEVNNQANQNKEMYNRRVRETKMACFSNGPPQKRARIHRDETSSSEQTSSDSDSDRYVFPQRRSRRVITKETRTCSPYQIHACKADIDYSYSNRKL